MSPIMFDENVKGTAIENLYPALTECFAIIICGLVFILFLVMIDYSTSFSGTLQVV